MAFEVVDQPFCSKPDYYADGQKCALSRPSMIATALRQMMQMTAEQRQRMAHIARKGMLSRYGIEVVVTQLRQRFQELEAGL